MRAAFLTPDGFEIREIPTPSYGADEILVETRACGISGGELFVYRNRQKLAEGHSRLGHEASGVIVGVGSQVTDVAVGDMITALGAGGFAEYFVTTPQRVAVLPEELSPTLVVGAAVARVVEAAQQFGIRAVDQVAIVGCGFMGLLALQMAQQQGAGFLCAIDAQIDRRRLAHRLGSSVEIDPQGRPIEDVVYELGEFSVVIEAEGTPESRELAADLVMSNGRLVLLDHTPAQTRHRAPALLAAEAREITIIDAFGKQPVAGIDSLREAVTFLRQGKLITQPLVTIYELDEIEQAFNDLEAGRQGLHKAVLVMGDAV